MDLPILRSTSELREQLRNPLYRNSLFIALGRITDVGFGFLFWTFAARLYSQGDVGVATALISSLTLVITLSRLGFDTALVRFLPSKEKSRALSTTLWITLVATLIIAILYLLLVPVITPELFLLRDYLLLFLLFALANSFENIAENALLAIRRADLRWVLHLFMGLRILLLFPFAFLGSFGIFSSVGAAYLAVILISTFFIRRHFVITCKISTEYLRDTFRFSSLNYLASFLASIPTLVFPILILNLLGAEEAALYYIAFTIGNLVLIVPDAMTTSFFVEGSHGVNLKKAAMHTLAATYAVLIPAILIIVLFGDLLLGLFGSAYLAAFDLLRLIAISALFVAIYNLFIPLQNIRLRVGTIVMLNLVRCTLLLGLGYMLTLHMGVIGIGYAWLATYAVLAGGIVVRIKYYNISSKCH
ncbi:MAG: oligosaccharide flippase family protein [Methanolinea sp.]|nr:oligosaccharide flippase family protein [Methanolinea sp.]